MILQMLFGKKKNEKNKKPALSLEMNLLQESNELMSLLDHPFSWGLDKYEYFAMGSKAEEVASLEPGISVSTDLQSSVEPRSFKSVLDMTDPIIQKHLNMRLQALIQKPYDIHTMIAHIAENKGHDAICWPSPRVKDGKILVSLRKS